MKKQGKRVRSWSLVVKDVEKRPSEADAYVSLTLAPIGVSPIAEEQNKYAPVVE